MKKILLLEDDIELNETLSELLSENGYDVDSAFDAQEAIDKSYDNRYDLYIFDINLPDMNGLELLESLRDALDKTPAIFISALIDLNSISKAFSISAVDYIKKPFFPQELLIRVDARLKSDIKSGIKYKNLEYFEDSNELYLDSKLIPLSDVLSCLCKHFFTNIGMVVDKEILLECLHSPSDSALRVAITKLKQLTNIELKNVRGVGYILEKG